MPGRIPPPSLPSSTPGMQDAAGPPFLEAVYSLIHAVPSCAHRRQMERNGQCHPLQERWQAEGMWAQSAKTWPGLPKPGLICR